MNMNHLEFITPMSIYHRCATQKRFWEEKSTLGEFTPVNMKNYGSRNVRKHREIKDSDKYTILDISLKFVSLENLKITSSEPKYYLVTSVKRMITSLGLTTNVRSKKYKKVKVCHY